ncbi:sensor histidine kinase [Microbacterium oleivorans]|uniref:sensor histidine kinase n=1 Tax=Microbacterium oleivorans TaxID=273677 RepID=UPI0020420E83|nr:sensor histidine kinase [Microbacterium oleivorans]MCM3695324.1 sensor histidine kinase [Microbacterium oleivorans]
MKPRRSWSIAGRIFGIQMGAVLCALGLLVTVLAFEAQWDAETEARDRSLAVSRMLATYPSVTAGLRDEDPTAVLQPIALSTMDASGVDFVTIMSPDGIRFTHPDPERIGGTFLGTISAARRGETITETFTGTLGPSVRAVVPVTADGELIGIVSAGVTTRQISDAVLPRMPAILLLALVFVAIGTVAAALTRRVVRRVAGDLAPERVKSMVSFYESVLHSVREGVVLTDGRGRIVLYNDEAADLLGLPPSTGEGLAEGLDAADAGVPPEIARLLATGERAVEEVHVGVDRVLLVNQEKTGDPAAPGAVMTLRDQSVLTELTGELDAVRTMSDALRSRTHEHSNVLHTIVGLLEAGRVDEAIDFIEESSQASQDLTDQIVGAQGEPVLSALLLGKSATAHELGIEFSVSMPDSLVLPLTPTELVSIVGNLVDNAFEAAREGEDPWVSVTCRIVGDTAEILVSDSGPGPHSDEVFKLGVSTKPGPGRGIGLALVRSIVDGRGGEVGFLPGAPATAYVRLPGVDAAVRS